MTLFDKCHLLFGGDLSFIFYTGYMIRYDIRLVWGMMLNEIIFTHLIVVLVQSG